ncbi:MAG: DUF308 domain-containing protein [Methanocella sp.]
MTAGALQQKLFNIWPQVLLRGCISLLLGLLMLVWPHASVLIYVEIFGAYALADGFLLILQALPVRKIDTRVWSRLLHGIIGVSFGAAVFLWAGFREIRMVDMFSMYLMLTGVLQVFTALDLYHVVRYDHYLIASGFLSVFCGLLLRTVPAGDAVQLARVFGIFMTAYAVIAILIALEMRSSASAFSKE